MARMLRYLDIVALSGSRHGSRQKPIRDLAGGAAEGGPYLLIELMLPGGSLVAAMLYLYRRKYAKALSAREPFMRLTRPFLACVLAVACVSLAGCGGAALLREARPLESFTSLAAGRDERIVASIEAVIVPHGAGAWAGNAEWDEYLIRIRSLSDERVEIRGIAIFDALDHRIEPRSDRGDLVDGTRETERRYEQAGKVVLNRGVNHRGRPPIEAAALVMANPVAGVIGIGVALPILGVARLVENARVDRKIQRRRTTLPVALPSGAEASVDLFFPITPLSGRTQVVYVDRHGEHRLDIDTRQALAELEPPPPTLVSRVDPEFPIHADWAGIKEGSVKARLTLDRQGSVQRVELVESVPSHVFDREARRTLRLWTYSGCPCDGRTVEATLEFRR